MPPHYSRGIHQPGLDLLRALAILFVFCFHYVQYFPHPEGMEWMASFGWTGVDLFFVLSGFLITAQLLAEREKTRTISLARFYIKRSFRILPAYWVVLAVYFLFPVLREVEGPAPLWKYLTFTQNFGIERIHHGAFSHAWSLCIEEQFYLVLPLILLGTRRVANFNNTLGAVTGLIVLGFLVRYFSWMVLVEPAVRTGNVMSRWATWIYYPTQSRLDGLLVGVLIASVGHYRPAVLAALRERAWWCAVLGVAGLMAARSFSTPFTTCACGLFGYPLISISYGLILISTTSPEFSLPAWIGCPARWLATLSYGIYLSHKLTVHWIQGCLIGWGMDGEGYNLLVGCFVVSVVVALLMHFAIERVAFKMRDACLVWQAK